ncbi:hypothetical protein ACFOZ7_22485 [Natribaculum luteum]|uniref:Uncharacterized protein n=1 Tax=Natribaculum luteum TaxID=1586232 RepID=A0ABD5P5T7_9EURY|nr:hypothetical protein [Natribaculum luteum]
MADRTEACGRCSVTTVVDAVDEGDDEGGRNPFDGERIELRDETMRRTAFVAVWLGRLKRRLDETVFSLVYGR